MSTTLDRPVDRLALGAAVVDFVDLTVERDGEVHPLTPLEADVVRYLWDRLGAVVSRDDLLRDVWRYRPGLSSRAVDNTMSRLRSKIEAHPRDAAHLRGVYGQGYVLVGACAAAPRPTPRAATPTNLPNEHTAFVGRAVELAALDASGPGLTTITGPAGAGKSRLVRAWAFANPGRFPGGTWQVALADVNDAAGAAAAVVRAVGGAPSASTEWAVGALGRALIVLDDAEHLVDALAPAVGRWVSATPEASWLVTSRRPLDLAVERRIRLDGLSVDEAVALVRDRAGVLGVAIDRDGALVALVDRLDRLPLALELVARRLGTFSADQVLARLDHGLSALGAGPRDVPERHASLVRAIGWSWDLLDPQEQAVLCACTVFRGGFDLDALEEVTADPLAAARLERLVDHALVRTEARPETRRFAPYESVRGFAAARAPAGAIDRWSERHARYYAQWGLALAGEVAMTEDYWRRRVLASELDNLLAAAERLERVDADAHAAAAVAVARAALDRGPLRTALALTARALDRAPSPPLADRVRLASAEIRLALGEDATDATDDLRRVEGAAEVDVAVQATRLQVMASLRADRLDDRGRLVDAAVRSEAAGLHHLAARLWVAISMVEAADPTASAARAEELARRIGYRSGEVRVAALRGVAAFNAADLVEAERRLREALAIAGPGDVHDASINLAWALATSEQVDEALALLDAAVAAGRGGGFAYHAAQAELLRWDVAQWAGAPDDAVRPHVERLAAWFRAGGMARMETVARSVLARARHDRGDLEGARAAFDAVLADAGADRYHRAEFLADSAALRWESGDDDGALAEFDASIAAWQAANALWGVQTTRLRRAAALAGRDPDLARAELRAWVGPSPPWVDAARDLVVGLCDPRAPRAAERLRRASATSPVRWLRPIGRRLEAAAHPALRAEPGAGLRSLRSSR